MPMQYYAYHGESDSFVKVLHDNYKGLSLVKSKGEYKTLPTYQLEPAEIEGISPTELKAMIDTRKEVNEPH